MRIANSSKKSRASVIVDRHFDCDALTDLIGTGSERAHALLRNATWQPLAQAVARPGKEFRGRLVEHAYAIAKTRALDASTIAPLAYELPQILELIHAGSLVIDDVEDNALVRRGAPALHRLVGAPAAINVGNFLYFLPIVLLSTLNLDPATSLTMHQRTARALLRCHHGQGLDLTIKVSEVGVADLRELVKLTTSLKTGSLMGLACSLGALAGGADLALEGALADFGCELGIALQMLDDLSGFLNATRVGKGIEDLMEQRATWAWAYASEAVDEPTIRGWQRISREIKASGRGADSLLAAMKPHLEVARRAPRRRLEAALNTLRSRIGTQDALEALASEIEALEKSYV
ncbi:MAG: polyprenyl synthetase family protein [Polyangiaceae bacterium]